MSRLTSIKELFLKLGITGVSEEIEILLSKLFLIELENKNNSQNIILKNYTKLGENPENNSQNKSKNEIETEKIGKIIESKESLETKIQEKSFLESRAKTWENENIKQNEIKNISDQIQLIIKNQFAKNNQISLENLESELWKVKNNQIQIASNNSNISKENSQINAKVQNLGQNLSSINSVNYQGKSKDLEESSIEKSVNLHIANKAPNIDENINLKLVESDKLGSQNQLLPNDMAYVRGQIVAKRALEIAASGGHNVLFLGSPGSGKTLLARAYAGILPSMTEEEILETTQIYSVAGMLTRGQIISRRPFRAPHHSASHVALVGGGSKIRPGEASLAHRGVLFLDEFPEFGRDTIEALRQPLEDGFVSIARASGSLTFPSKFYLLAAANPTPSGFDPDDPDALNKPQNRAAISRYQARFSGPIMDRIDIHVEVSRPKKEELQSTEIAEKSSQIAKRVQNARNIQTARFREFQKNTSYNSDSTNNFNFIQSNSEMSLPLIQKFCVLDDAGQKILSSAIDRFKLSARAYMRILKLSRTIADLDNSPNILPKHLAESLQYRGRWS